MLCTTGTVSVVAVALVMFTDLPNGRDFNGVIEKAHTSALETSLTSGLELQIKRSFDT